jgi:4-hydroxy-3-polyprenylbenzoate decarboxylase
MAARKRRITVALSGASGMVYGLRVLEELLRDDRIDVHLTISSAARQVMALELGLQVDLQRFRPGALGIANAQRAIYHHITDLAAPISSGSYRVDAMAIVPCSMGCVGAIAHGLADDLIQRAADVMIKERRKLVVVPRETPLSVIHLENLLTLARAGVVVLPAAPGFYGKPKEASELVDFVVARVLDHLEVEHQVGRRWGERRKK